MNFGSMKEVSLSRARDMFVFDCYVGGFELPAVNAYRQALNAFIHFTGDIRVRQLTPDHVEVYTANLFDGPPEGPQHQNFALSQYAMIQTWTHWMYSQKFITERGSNSITAPHFAHLFPPRSARRLAHGE